MSGRHQNVAIAVFFRAPGYLVNCFKISLEVKVCLHRAVAADTHSDYMSSGVPAINREPDKHNATKASVVFSQLDGHGWHSGDPGLHFEHPHHVLNAVGAPDPPIVH